MALTPPWHGTLVIVAATALVPLSGCSKSSDRAESTIKATAAPGSDTLAEALSKQGDLSTLSRALRDTGLSQVFDDSGSYTIFAPTDAGFDKLGTAGKALQQPSQRAALAAVLRDHIVPGYLTPDDIGTAIEDQHGQARVKTMGDHNLTFTRDGQGYRVTGEDGSSALIAGEAVTASNGVAIPVDGVVKKL